jgi:hypothetical protein
MLPEDLVFDSAVHRRITKTSLAEAVTKDAPLSCGCAEILAGHTIRRPQPDATRGHESAENAVVLPEDV